jgi:hypothetical protein
MTSVAGERDFEARRAEIAAIREELATRRIEIAELSARGKVEHLRSREKALRLKAETAFLAVGGARGDFARHWPALFIEEVRNHRES